MSVPDSLIGSQLGDYRIIDLLGRGGMARVFRGYDANLDRYAAVKVIDPIPGAEENHDEYRQRFLREARAVARLNHPNIVGVYQFGEYENLYYMAMVFIDGRDLGEILKEPQPVARPQILRIIHDLASALDYAHAGGVIHRDVKPSNIMVTKEGQAILTDFGLALSVPEGTIGNTFGSVHYIAPEQAVSSARAVPQSDLYALGVVLYQMLTGRVPFDEESAMSIALMHLNDPPPPMRQYNPAISAEVEAVVLKALEKEPDDRYHNGEAMARALEQALGISTISDSHLPPLPLLKPAEAEPAIGKTSSTIVFPPSKPSIPALPLASAAEAGAVDSGTGGRRRWGLLLLGAGILVLILAAAVWARGSASVVTPTATTAAVVQLDTPPPSEETGVVTSSPTLAPTDTARPPSPTPLPTQPPLVEVIATETDEILSETPTETPEPETPTSTPALTEAAVTPDAEQLSGEGDVMLIYDDSSFTLINRSADTVDVSGITFVQTKTDGSQLSFRSDQWTNGTRPVWSLTAGDCFQIWQLNQPELPVPEDCVLRHAWRAVAAPRWFWLSDAAGAAFEVRRDADVLATCPVDAGLCQVDLGE